MCIGDMPSASVANGGRIGAFFGLVFFGLAIACSVTRNMRSLVVALSVHICTTFLQSVRLSDARTVVAIQRDSL